MDELAKRLTRVNAACSLLLGGVLLAAYVAFHSQLALAQSADSLLDVLTALVLAAAIAVATAGSDDRHHFGHRPAEPIAALGVAMTSGVLAVQVVEHAIDAMLLPPAVEPAPLLLAAFGAKGAFKVLVLMWISRRGARRGSPVLSALFIDARNDVLLTVVAVVGFLSARLGHAGADAWLALPIGLWIGWSGIELGRENLRLLMGEAPSDERQAELVRMAGVIDGVESVHELRAHHFGSHLRVHLHVVVDPNLTVGQAHDIGDAVRLRLETEPDVAGCAVHLDVSDD